MIVCKNQSTKLHLFYPSTSSSEPKLNRIQERRTLKRQYDIIREKLGARTYLSRVVWLQKYRQELKSYKVIKTTVLKNLSSSDLYMVNFSLISARLSGRLPGSSPSSKTDTVACGNPIISLNWRGDIRYNRRSCTTSVTITTQTAVVGRKSRVGDNLANGGSSWKNLSTARNRSDFYSGTFSTQLGISSLNPHDSQKKSVDGVAQTSDDSDASGISAPGCGHAVSSIILY